MTTTEPLLIKTPEAAKMLNVSPRKLWGLTAANRDDGKGIPCVKIGRAVRYDPADLRAWRDSQKIGSLAS